MRKTPTIIKKPWGHEEIWAQGAVYAGKILVIQKGHRLSRQYHKVKDESIYVLDGTLILEIGPKESMERFILPEGSSWRIERRTIHRFAAPASGCILIEVSTPEDDDVVRLEDDYGR